MRALPRLQICAAVLAASSLVAGCTASSQTPSDAPTTGAYTDDPNNAELTYWYWAESDAPGANDWMKSRITEYQTKYPGVKISLVPQATDTLIGAFTTAAQTKSGPDIGTQWATIPVLSQAWAGAITPISDLTTEAQRSSWINASENTDQGKVWGVPLYIIGIPLAYNKDLLTKAGIAKPPATFDELLSACDSLRAAGVTPIGGGNKDGFFGAWFFSNFGKQNLDTVSELKQAVIGTNDLSSSKYTGFYTAMAQLRDRKCFNDDIASLNLDQGSAVFGSGKSAMSWGTDGMISNWAKTLGADKIGVAPTPKWGTGKLADVYNTTQSSSAFVTSWSKHPRAAAQFLTWLHDPANVTSWYKATGVFPADTTFDKSLMSTDLVKSQWALTSLPDAVWLENFLPPAVDGDGDLAAGQTITSGGTPAEAVATFVAAAEKWRTQNPVEVEAYTAWAGR